MQQQQNKNVFETHASAAAERCLSSTLDSCSAWFGYMLESCPEWFIEAGFFLCWGSVFCKLGFQLVYGVPAAFVLLLDGDLATLIIRAFSWFFHQLWAAPNSSSHMVLSYTQIEVGWYKEPVEF